MNELNSDAESAVRRALPWAQRVHLGDGEIRWSAVRVYAEPSRELSHDLLDRAPAGSGEHPLVVRLRAHNGDDPLPPEGYRLSLRLEEAGAAMEVVGTDTAGIRQGARSASALLRAGHATGLPPLRVDDWPSVPRRGFMECFYGAPWSPRERVHLLEQAAGLGLNTYCYGPAADPRTGALWGTRYETDELTELAAVVRAGERLGVEFIWRVSPSAPLDPPRGARLSNPDDAAALADKLLQLASIGVCGFIVAFDDLSVGLAHHEDRAAFAADPHPVAAAQASFLNAVRDAVCRRAYVDITCCPTLYWGTEDAGGYRRRLGELLDPQIAICWTGPAVVAATVDGAGARLTAGQFGRDKLWLWDNYPVNDWDAAPVIEAQPQPRRLLLGPLRGRDADAAPTLRAYTVNCGTESAAALPILSTVAAWTWNPQRYDAAHAWELGVATAFAGCGCRRDGMDCSTAFRRFAELHELSPLAPDALGWLRPAVSSFLTGADGVAASAVLHARLAEAEAVAVRLSACDRPAARALGGWLRRLAAEAAVARDAADVIDAARAGAPIPLPAAERLRSLDVDGSAHAAGGALVPLIEHGWTVAGPTAPSLDFLDGPRTKNNAADERRAEATTAAAGADARRGTE